jgi:hypothetical protein
MTVRTLNATILPYMILIPSFEPTNFTIEDKIQYAINNLENYKTLTTSQHLEGHINFVLPGYLEDKPGLNINLISPNIVDPTMVKDILDLDIVLYINYFASQSELVDSLTLFDNDFIFNSKILSPTWDITVFVPIHTIESMLNKTKFNIKYGLTLVGSEINLMNIQKYTEMGITHFNLHFLDLPNSFTYQEAKVPLLKELSKFKDSEFIICAKDARLLKLTDNCKVVVSSVFWNDIIH